MCFWAAQHQDAYTRETHKKANKQSLFCKNALITDMDLNFRSAELADLELAVKHKQKGFHIFVADFKML